MSPATALAVSLTPVVLVGGFMRLVEGYRDDDDPSGIWRFLVPLVCGGGFAVVATLQLASVVTDTFARHEEDLLFPLVLHALLLPCVEEVCKAAPLWWMAFRGYMRDPLDVSLMAIVAGVGFASSETLVALLIARANDGDFFAQAQIRLAFAVPLHAAATLLAVRPIAAAKPASIGNRIFLALLAATLLHGAWNGSLLLSDLSRSPMLAIAALLLPAMAAMWIIVRVRRDILALRTRAA